MTTPLRGSKGVVDGCRRATAITSFWILLVASFLAGCLFSSSRLARVGRVVRWGLQLGVAACDSGRHHAGATGASACRCPTGSQTAHACDGPHHHVCRTRTGSDCCAVVPRPLLVVPRLAAAHAAAGQRLYTLSSPANRSHCRPDWRTILRRWQR